MIFALALSVSAAAVPPLHPAEQLRSGVTEAKMQSLFAKVAAETAQSGIKPHPAESLKTGITLEELLEGYTVLEVTKGTGYSTDGSTLSVDFYRVEKTDPQEAAAESAAHYVPCPVGSCEAKDLLGVDVVKNQSTGACKYYVCHYGCKLCGTVYSQKIINA